MPNTPAATRFWRALPTSSAKYGAPTYIHCAETLGEVGECSVRRALTPVEYLHKIGFFDNGGIIAHGTYLDKNDIALLNDKNVCVASNPSSNLKLASGVAPYIPC